MQPGPGLYRAAIFLVLGTAYALTLAPDLTWGHFSADGGDLIVAAAADGVPHPTGYPLYLLLAKAFQSLPVGSLPFRTNLLSAVCTVSAAEILFDLIRGQIKERSARSAVASFGALSYGLAPAVWGQALVTEVYALHGLLLIACLYGFMKTGIPEWIRGALFGLAVCNHLTSVLIFPLLLLYGDKKGIVQRFLGAFCFSLLYLTLPLRASHNPPVNWGNASTPDGFMWLLSGGPYREYAFQFSVWTFFARLRSVADLALEQFPAFGVILALYGLFSLQPSRILLATLWSSLAFLSFSVVYASYDSHVYLIVLWINLSIWLSIGLDGFIEAIRAYSLPASRAILLLAFVFLFWRIPAVYPKVDLSRDTQALEFIQHTLGEIPPNAIVFAAGDEETFSLWYAHFVLRHREDIVVIAEGLLQFEWYGRTLRGAYPGFAIPRKSRLLPYDLVIANPERSACYVSLSNVKCLCR